MATSTIDISLFDAKYKEGIISVDTLITSNNKSQYWHDFFVRLENESTLQGFVAHENGRVVGYIVGEIRAWEFGQEPCGWVFTLGVDPEFNRQGVGKKMLDELTIWFKESGVNKMRTMVSLDQDQMHRFFRTNNFISGPFMQLEAEV